MPYTYVIGPIRDELGSHPIGKIEDVHPWLLESYSRVVRHAPAPPQSPRWIKAKQLAILAECHYHGLRNSAVSMNHAQSS